jgi:hypothetical protein
MSRARVVLLVAGLGAVLPPLAHAQTTATVDFGLGGAPTTRSANQARWSVAPNLAWSAARWRFDATGEYRELAPTGHGLVGSARGSWFAGIARPLRLEVTAEGRGMQDSRDTFRGTWGAGLRLHLADDTRGLWLGSQLGSDRFGGTLRWEGAAWRRWGLVSFQLRGWQLTALNQLRETSPFDTLSPMDSLRQQLKVTTDVGAWLRWTPGRFDLGAATGWRIGATEPGDRTGLGADGSTSQGSGDAARTRARQWWMVEGTWWFSSRAGLHSEVGTYPSEIALGTSSGSFFRLGIRATLTSNRGSPVRRPGGSGFESRRGDYGVEFILNAPSARRVELMADFTDWAPVDMAPVGAGRWRLTLPVSSGLHHVNVRYDGGPWRSPPGTRKVRDEFDRETGVMVVD